MGLGLGLGVRVIVRIRTRARVKMRVKFSLKVRDYPCSDASSLTQSSTVSVRSDGPSGNSMYLEKRQETTILFQSNAEVFSTNGI